MCDAFFRVELELAKASAAIGVTLIHCEALANTVEGYIAARVGL